MSTLSLLVRKDALGTTRLRSGDDTPLASGQVRVRVESFALTSNNITYAAFGEKMNYWDFFPSADEGFGIVPVWGFGSVVQSLHPGVAVGERLYGYFPMADQVVLQPERMSPEGFFDAAPHRAALPSIYNRYARCNADPFHTSGNEDIQALLHPLYITSWLIDDFLADNEFFGADTVLLSSASSKTAYGTAFQLAQRPGIEVVGLTSPGNKLFCESLGCYGRVVGYDELELIPTDSACVYVDFAGNAALRLAVHTRFVDLRYSASIGGTHVDQLGGAGNLPGPRATLFFAPSQARKRVAELGLAGFTDRTLTAWKAFVDTVTDPAAPWLVADHHRGPEAVQAAYLEVLGGRSHPRVGHILSMHKP
ncbi:MAG: DUF2855 family protein [Variovorax sp.]